MKSNSVSWQLGFQHPPKNPDPGGVITGESGQRHLSGARLGESWTPGLKAEHFVAGTGLQTLWSLY